MTDALPRSASGRPTFYVQRTDRLIARMKHILYACRFARQVGGLVVALWPEPSARSKLFDGDDYSPRYIFDLDTFEAAGGRDWLCFLQTNARLPTEAPSLAGPDFAAFRNNRFHRESFAADGLVFADSKLMNYHFVGEDPRPPQVAAELREIFASIPLHPDLSRRLARFKEDLGGRYTCVHFRAGDVYLMNREDLPKLAQGALTPQRLTVLMGHFVVRTAPLELYAKPIEDAIEAGEKIVFASDSPDYISKFKDAFGSRHFVDLAAYTTDHPIQKAMFDFLVLMGSRQILGTRSNYASLAAALGGGGHVTVSAAGVTKMPPEPVIDLYIDTALREFLPGLDLPPVALTGLRDEVRRQYLFVNRIGDKAELSFMDPRKPRSTAPARP